MNRKLLLACLFAARLGTAAGADTAAVVPLSQVRAGMHGVGKTVFHGDRIEEFSVEILGILENIGPKQSLILGRLSGGPLAETGVMQGMSGSPVYIGGKLIGAVAMAFPFSKEPIAGIRPIEEMLKVSRAPGGPRRIETATLAGNNWLGALPQPASGGGMQLANIATPLAFGGFTQTTIDAFAPKLRALGMDPRQGVSVGGGRMTAMGDPARLHPGSMISVQMMTGDMSVGADGTVTHIDADQVYAFGHRFFALGPTGLPFSRAEVISLLPNVNTSFKISAARELMGLISQDRDAAISGRLGARAAMIPLDIEVTRAGIPLDAYHMHMVNDRLLSPVMLQMAVFSAIDATERAAGSSTIALRGTIEFQQRPPVELRGLTAGDANSAMQTSLAATIPLAYILAGGFDQLQVKGIRLSLDSTDRKRIVQIEDVMASRKEVRPGDRVEISALFAGENGIEITRTAHYDVPAGAPAGTLYFTVADGSMTSLADLRQALTSTPRSPEQLLETVNRLKPNTRAYVRVWRGDPDFQVSGEDLPSLPPSAALVMANAPGLVQTRNSKVQELELNAGDLMVTGSKTVQVEVRP